MLGVVCSLWPEPLRYRVKHLSRADCSAVHIGRYGLGGRTELVEMRKAVSTGNQSKGMPVTNAFILLVRLNAMPLRYQYKR